MDPCLEELKMRGKTKRLKTKFSVVVACEEIVFH